MQLFSKVYDTYSDREQISKKKVYRFILHYNQLVFDIIINFTSIRISHFHRKKKLIIMTMSETRDYR